MTLQEATERIKVYNEIYSKNLPCEMPMNKAFIMAVNALEKQIPKKPKVLDSEYCCRDCHEKIWLTKPKYKRQRYCLNCGQAIDWSDTE